METMVSTVCLPACLPSPFILSRSEVRNRGQGSNLRVRSHWVVDDSKQWSTRAACCPILQSQAAARWLGLRPASLR
jgi:hypothetical protein